MMAFALPAYGQDFSVTINASSGNPMSDLTFGMSPTATDGNDFMVDVLHPPKPPGGIFDAALVWNNERYFTQIIASSTQERIWGIDLQFTDPITLTWDSSGLAALGTFVIEDAATSGTLVSADMTTESMVVISNTAVTLLNVIVDPNGGGGNGSGGGGGTATSGAGGTGGSGGSGTGGTATSTVGTGGSPANGGTGGTLGSGGSSASGGGETNDGPSNGSSDSDDSGDCSCRLDRTPNAPQPLALWLMAAALYPLRRRRPRSPRA